MRMLFAVELAYAPSGGPIAMPPSAEAFTPSVDTGRRLGVAGLQVVRLHLMAIPYNRVK
jgi:hypothetical protein